MTERHVSPPLRVLHLLGELRPSGMERMLVSASTGFRANGIRTYVVGQGTENPYAQTLEEAGLNVHILTLGILSRAGRKQFAALIASERIDVVHIHTERRYLFTVGAVLAASRGRVRIVRTVHNVFLASGRWFISRLIQAAIADRFVGCVVAPSEDVARNERRLGRSTRLVYNWVDDRFFELRKVRELTQTDRDQRERRIALVVGNCSTIKRHELAIAAVQNADHDLIHLGSEVHAEEQELALLTSLATRGRLADRGIKPPDAALLLADYFVMPSRHEGMPVALAEALVAGVPVFATSAPGMQWSKCAGGVTLLPAQDEAWYDAIQGDLMPTSSVVSPIDFSAERGVQQYVEIYQMLVTTRRGPGC
jgi:glycosyltransferase involved in cell wall biosynthesis